MYRAERGVRGRLQNIEGRCRQFTKFYPIQSPGHCHPTRTEHCHRGNSECCLFIHNLWHAAMQEMHCAMRRREDRRPRAGAMSRPRSGSSRPHPRTVPRSQRPHRVSVRLCAARRLGQPLDEVPLCSRKTISTPTPCHPTSASAVSRARGFQRRAPERADVAQAPTSKVCKPPPGLCHHARRGRRLRCRLRLRRRFRRHGLRAGRARRRCHLRGHCLRAGHCHSRGRRRCGLSCTLRIAGVDSFFSLLLSSMDSMHLIQTFLHGSKLCWVAHLPEHGNASQRFDDFFRDSQSCCKLCGQLVFCGQCHTPRRAALLLALPCIRRGKQPHQIKVVSPMFRLRPAGAAVGAKQQPALDNDWRSVIKSLGANARQAFILVPQAPENHLARPAELFGQRQQPHCDLLLRQS